MSCRITPDEVKEVIKTTLENQVIKNSMIATANLVVDGNLLSYGHSTDLLRIIELYLAAHFVCLTEEKGGLVRSSTGDGAETYSDIYSEGLKSTRFGQQALALDTSGALARISTTTLKAELRVV